MANTTVATSDAQAVKLFLSKLMATEVEKKMTMKQFMGNEDSAIQKLDALQRSAGDTINYQIVYKLSGQGKTGSQTLEGHEEVIPVKNASVSIDQLRHAAGKYDRMSQKRTFVEYTKLAMKMLATWFAEWCDEALFIYLSGTRGTNDPNGKFPLGWTGFAGNSISAADSNHIRYCTDTGLSATASACNDTLEVTHLDLANVVIKELQGTSGQPGMSHLSLGGRPKFLFLVSPRQRYHMMQQNADNLIEKINIGKIQGGNTTDYIFQDGIDYTDFAIYENVNVRKATAGGGTSYTGVDSGMTVVNFGLILGAQAGVVAYGSPNGGFDNVKIDTETFDYGDKVGYAGSVIAGFRKNTFADPIDGTSRDLGAFVLVSQAES